ncbi:MAG: ATP-binding cassette domain-containing protein [Planctomycetota bacterium]
MISSEASVTLAPFGVCPRDASRVLSRRRARTRSAAQRLDAQLRPGEIAFVTGPSGAGKSMLLDALAADLDRNAVLPPPGRSRRALIDWVHPDPCRAMRLLSRCGLADARDFLTPVDRLSAGQLARARVARSIGTRRGTTVVVDEFCSVLDETTAKTTARCVARAFRATCRTRRLVLASARWSTIDALRPDLLVYIPLDEEASSCRR